MYAIAYQKLNFGTMFDGLTSKHVVLYNFLKKMRKIGVIVIGEIFLLSGCLLAQPSYNNCATPMELCPNQVATVNNIGATKTLCGGCEDDFNYCFVPLNTVWFTFTTNNTGGDIQVNLSNPIFEIEAGRGTSYHACLISANIGCNAVSYSLMGNCVSDAVTNQAIVATALLPNTTYYLVMSGDASGVGVSLPAEFTIDITISGTAVDRVFPTMTANLTTSNCLGSLVSLEAQRFDCPNASSFRWFVNSVLRGQSLDSTFSFSAIQSGDTLSVESDCFVWCPVIVSQTIAPISLSSVWADAGNDTSILKGEMIQLNGLVSTNTVFVWSPSFSLSDPTVLSPIAYPNQTTTYTLMATDTISGCSTTDYITVVVESDLFVPNTFSPNNDGDNDTWVILGIERFPDCLVSIYSRWGQLVFQTTGYNKQKAWNGESNAGRKVNESVYFYEIHLRDASKQTLKGSITVLR